jgi:transcriptional regulator with XRE-family HTH domain
MSDTATATQTTPGDDRDRKRNDLLRQAGLRTPSPSNSDQPMSQRELAEAVTAHLFRHTTRVVALDRHYISRLERGRSRWPIADYRNALRAVLNAATDADLGFCVKPRRFAERRVGQTEAVARIAAHTTGRTTSVKVETIRFVARNDDEAYFVRAMHHLTGGCLLLGAKDEALAAMLDVMNRAIGRRHSPRDPISEPWASARG